MTLSFFITVIPDHDKPQPPGCLLDRFRMGRTPETGLTPAEWCEFPRYALVRILMHAVKTEPARFWRVFGWFVACFTGFPSETP
ncbi:hypothetical protein FMP14_24380 [Escherichia coli]|nr:hypothetical protein [Escherichia coli]